MARLVTDEDFIQRKVLTKAMLALGEDGDFGTDPLELAFRGLEAARKALGVRDPYEKVKARATKSVLGLEAAFRTLIDTSPDPLATAILLSLAGAEADVAALGRDEVETSIRAGLERAPARDGRVELAAELRAARSVMLVLDRAGEAVLDRFLAERLAGNGVQVTVVASAKPFLAMATAADAKAAKFNPEWVIDPGAEMYGLAVEKASSEFEDRFTTVDVVVAKGEAHFEALRTAGRPVWSMLHVDCPSVAARLGVTVGTGVVARSN